MASNSSRTRAIKRALGLGAVAGLRSLSAPALLTYAANKNELGLQNTPFAWFESRQASLAFSLLGATEMVADKLPAMPARTSPIALAGRAGMGALVGAAAFSSEEESLAMGAAIGALAALAATFGAYYLRSSATEKRGVPNVVAGLIEDSIVAGAGWAVLATTRD